MLTNPPGFTQRVKSGATLGITCEAAVVEPLEKDILLLSQQSIVMINVLTARDEDPE